MAHKPEKLAALAVIKQAAEPMSLSAVALRLGSVPERTLRRWFNVWIDERVLEKLGQGRSTRYRYLYKEIDPTASFAFLSELDIDLRHSY